MMKDQPIDLKEERRKIYVSALLALVVCAVTLAGGYVILPRYFTFPEALADRLAFTLRADLLILLWVFIGVKMVADVRRNSPSDSRGSAFGPPSPRLAIRAAFLQNTLEQAFLAVVTHLALASVLSGPALALIPAAVVLFGIGRVTFFIGYPAGAGGRAFGMATTALPTLVGFVAAIALVAVRL